MKINDVVLPKPLNESVKARIAHPEDLVWQEGSSGAKSALSKLTHIVNDSTNLTLKWDGSVSLIVGRDPADNKLVVTDKSGFNAKGYDGLTKNANALYDMLLQRKPNENGRTEYASLISKLWPLFEKAIPKNVTGYFQSDLLYTSTPDIINNYFTFKPNKILYKVLVDSKPGQQIKSSQVGIVVHGYMKDQTSKLVPFNDIALLQNNPELLIFSTDMTAIKLNIPAPKLHPDIIAIDKFLDKAILRPLKITDLGSQFGKYIAHLARLGNNDYSNASVTFVNWLNTANISNNKKDAIKQYIDDNKYAYNIMWETITVIANFKTKIKQQIDNTHNNEVQAYLDDKVGHEGYVSTTSSGVIKLVDRHKFMRESSIPSKEIDKDVIVIFSGRFQAPHRGHVDSWNWLMDHFGPTYVATSDKVAGRRSPFNFNEKRKLLAFAGIPKEYIVQVSNPYRADEIVSRYDATNTILIFAVSEKDMSGRNPRFDFKRKKDGTASYFKKLTHDPKTLDKHGYIVVVPTFEFDVNGKEMTSATDFREEFADASIRTQAEMIKDLYGKYHTGVHKLFKAKIKPF